MEIQSQQAEGRPRFQTVQIQGESSLQKQCLPQVVYEHIIKILENYQIIKQQFTEKEEQLQLHKELMMDTIKQFQTHEEKLLRDHPQRSRMYSFFDPSHKTNKELSRKYNFTGRRIFRPNERETNGFEEAADRTLFSILRNYLLQQAERIIPILQSSITNSKLEQGFAVSAEQRLKARLAKSAEETVYDEIQSFRKEVRVSPSQKILLLFYRWEEIFNKVTEKLTQIRPHKYETQNIKILANQLFTYFLNQSQPGRIVLPLHSFLQQKLALIQNDQNSYLMRIEEEQSKVSELSAKNSELSQQLKRQQHLILELQKKQKKLEEELQNERAQLEFIKIKNRESKIEQTYCGTSIKNYYKECMQKKEMLFQMQEQEIKESQNNVENLTDNMKHYLQICGVKEVGGDPNQLLSLCMIEINKQSSIAEDSTLPTRINANEISYQEIKIDVEMLYEHKLNDMNERIVRLQKAKHDLEQQLQKKEKLTEKLFSNNRTSLTKNLEIQKRIREAENTIQEAVKLIFRQAKRTAKSTEIFPKMEGLIHLIKETFHFQKKDKEIELLDKHTLLGTSEKELQHGGSVLADQISEYNQLAFHYLQQERFPKRINSNTIALYELKLQEFRDDLRQREISELDFIEMYDKYKQSVESLQRAQKINEENEIRYQKFMQSIKNKGVQNNSEKVQKKLFYMDKIILQQNKLLQEQRDEFQMVIKKQIEESQAAVKEFLNSYSQSK